MVPDSGPHLSSNLVDWFAMSPPESGFDPSRTPPVPPPPGVISNFTDPDSLSATCLAINVSFLAIAGVFVILRFYTRACITRRVGWDDCKFIAAGLQTPPSQ